MAELLQIQLHGFPMISFLAMFAAFWALSSYLTRGARQRASQPAVGARPAALPAAPPAAARPAAAEQKLAA